MENIVITEQGKQLMSKVISETESMTFTKIAVSDYDYSGIELQNISELQSVKQTTIISKTSRTDGKTVEILAAINNEQIPESYYVRTLGVYVKDSSENEILYGISISGENPDYMPAYEGKTLSGVSYRINVAVEDSEYITVNVNPAAVPTIMQVEDIDTAFREHTEDKVSHITAAERKKWDAVTEKVNKEKGKGLSHNDFTDADKKKLDGIDDGANKTVIDSELSETSTNPVENKVIYQEKIKRMAQNWSGSEQYSSLGIGEPDSSTQIGSYLDVESGKVYYGGNSSWSYVYTLSSIYDVLDNKVNKSNIVNNLVTTEEGYALDARQLNKSVENSFAYEIDKSISAINNSLTQFTFVNVISGMKNYTAFYNSITKMMFVCFDISLGHRATASTVAILNDHAHTIDGNAYMFPVSAWNGATGNIVLSYGYISGQDINIYVPVCSDFNAYGMLFYHCK